jgi:hemerythrin-like domain-containing protein
MAIIRSEHRSMREVLQKMKTYVHAMLNRTLPCESGELRLMLQYIRTFPESLHHPKEDVYLFAKLRQRTADMDAVIEQLAGQHTRGEEWLNRLELALTRFERGFPPALDAFKTVLEEYCELQGRHMDTEESLILPAAAQHFSVEDWEEVASAFGSNGDLRFSPEREKPCRTLYARISRLAPLTANRE